MTDLNQLLKTPANSITDFVGASISMLREKNLLERTAAVLVAPPNKDILCRSVVTIANDVLLNRHGLRAVDHERLLLESQALAAFELLDQLNTGRVIVTAGVLGLITRSGKQITMPSAVLIPQLAFEPYQTPFYTEKGAELGAKLNTLGIPSVCGTVMTVSF